MVVTVCNNAAGETCPAFLGDIQRLHWDIEDPAKATGNDAEIDGAFETVYLILQKNIEDLLLNANRQAL